MKRSVNVIPDYAPTKRTKTTKNKRKQYTPRKISGGPTFDPTPHSIKVRMRYAHIITLGNNADGYNGYTSHVFRCNSVYDPDYSHPLGRRALGLSLYDDLYGKYRVIKSYIKVAPIDSINKGSMFIAKTATPNLTSTELEVVAEKKETNFRVIQENNDKRVMYHKFSMKDDLEFEQADWCPTNSNPNPDWFWHVGYSGLTACPFMVQIVYDVELTDRLTVTTG